MLLFTTNGWFYYQDSKGALTVLVSGAPAISTNLLFQAGPLFSNKNAAEAALGNYRKWFNLLLYRVMKSGNWIPPVEKSRLESLFSLKNFGNVLLDILNKEDTRYTWFNHYVVINNEELFFYRKENGDLIPELLTMDDVVSYLTKTFLE